MRSKGLGPEKYNLPRWETIVAPHIAFNIRDIKMLFKKVSTPITLCVESNTFCA
jgi:CO dehydrogenase/acetyl-CoA synthase delta subunit